MGAPATTFDPALAAPGELSPLELAFVGEDRPHSRPVPFPGPLGARGVAVCFYAPSDEEVVQAQAAATRWLKSQLQLDEFHLAAALEKNLYEAEEQRQLLALVMRDGKNPASAFATADALRRRCSPDVRQVLMRHLAAWIDEEYPERQAPDPETVVGMLLALKEAGSLSDSLTSYGFASLRDFVISLVEALWAQRHES